MQLKSSGGMSKLRILATHCPSLGSPVIYRQRYVQIINISIYIEVTGKRTDHNAGIHIHELHPVLYVVVDYRAARRRWVS